MSYQQATLIPELRAITTEGILEDSMVAPPEVTSEYHAA